MGNFALVSKNVNKDLAQLPFEQKAKILRKSNLAMTRKIANDYEEWNTQAIETRQEELAQFACKLWRID